MNTIKLAAAGILAMGLAGLASAQTTISIVGSTAFRTAAVKAEEAVLANVKSDGTFLLGGGPATVVYDGTSDTGATFSTIKGYDAAGNLTYYRNHWTGSVAGVLDVAQVNVTLTYIPESTADSAAIGVKTKVVAGTDYTAVTGAPDVAFTDAQSTDCGTDVASQGAAGAADSAAISAASLVEAGSLSQQGAATVNFAWTLGAYSGAGPTNWMAANGSSFTSTGAMPLNMTQQNAAYLIANGVLPLSSVTGVAADSVNFLFYIGRNEDSGSRVCYQAESLAAGTAGSTAVGHTTTQWLAQQNALISGSLTAVALPTGPGGTDAVTGANIYGANPNPRHGLAEYPTLSAASTISNIRKWPQKQDSTTANVITGGWSVSTIPALTWNSTGHSGYNGGGDIAAILETPVDESAITVTGAPNGFSPGTSHVYLVSCLGVSDSNNVKAAGNGALQLAYNGVPYSVPNLQVGQYSIWNIEHIYYLPALAGTQKTVADELADGVFNSANLAPAGTNLGTVTAIRTPGAGSEIH